MGIEWFTPHVVTAVMLLCIAFVLSASIGLERERQFKSAGLRTHTLVGLGSALFTLVGVYGFEGMVAGAAPGDPGRIAAQVVTGIGFLGAGVIFVRKAVVSGLTTAASIWVTAAVGMACGAGMPLVALAATLLYFLATIGLASVGRWITEHHSRGAHIVQLRYDEGSGVLRHVMESLTSAGCEVMLLESSDVDDGQAGRRRVDVVLRVEHTRVIPTELVERFSRLEGVSSVRVDLGADT